MRTRRPQTHDYSGSARCFGHDLIFRPVEGGQRATATGWGDGLREGDYLILDNPGVGDGTTRYGIASITYERDPADMWSADLVFDPR